MKGDRHPVARSWVLPPEGRAPLAPPLARTNLRALAARPGRFEHHLMVVARIGSAQLEHATASEPLYFAHANVSDEYALPLTTGDALVDGLPFRVFLSRADTLADVARINHRAGDLVLHPHGLLHWPGRLRPPFEPPRFPPGARRAVHSLVFCASRDTPPRERPLTVPREREGDAKAYEEPAPPMLLAPMDATPEGVIARVGHAVLEVASPPFAPPRGGYVMVLDAEPGADAFACDLVHVPAGATYEGEGVASALVFTSEDDTPVDPPPPSWAAVPAPPFAPFTESSRASLPVVFGALEVRDAGAHEVAIGGARVPRYWLARMLFRLALHGFALGYLETYGGFFYDDRGAHRVGVRGGASVEIPRDRLLPVIESLYRAVAPVGYVEDLR